MAAIVEGTYSGAGKRVAIIVARFNSFITERLVEGARDALTRHGVAETDITIVRVPGSFEIPPVVHRLAFAKQYDAVICLGAVIRGGTPHWEYVASEAVKGIAQVSLSAPIPVLFGVLTCDTIEQAVERAGTKAGNKGFDAALSALEMMSLLPQLPPLPSSP